MVKSSAEPLRTWTIALLIVVASAPCLLAQTTGISPPPADTDPIVRVSVDLAAGAFDRVLPFDVPFFIAGRAPEGARGLEVQYAVFRQAGDTLNPVWMPGVPIGWKPDGPATGDQTFLVLVRTPLDARRRYLFRFSFLSDRLSGGVITVEGRTSPKSHVSADIGLLYAGDIDIGAVYVGANIYFRPINTDAPLSEASSIGRRLALTVGITVSPVSDENDRTRSDLFWNQSLVLGAGYRLTSSIRAGERCAGFPGVGSESLDQGQRSGHHVVCLLLVRRRRREDLPMRSIACWLMLAAMTSACHKPEDYLLSPSQIDRMLNVTVSAATISADGISRATITAQLDSRTDADKRDVTFATTAGTLIAGGREGLTITVPADSAGKAVAELRSAVTPATAQIEVTAGSIRRASSVAFLALARDDVFDVSASRSTLPADGFSRAVITARLRRPAPLQQRTVTFETSAGIADRERAVERACTDRDG